MRTLINALVLSLAIALGYALDQVAHLDEGTERDERTASPLPGRVQESAALPPPRSEPPDPVVAEAERLDRVRANLVGAPLPFDETVPPGARPAAIAGYLDAFAEDGVRVLDWRCDQYPCVVAVSHPEGLAFPEALEERVHASDPNLAVNVLGPVSNFREGEDGHALSVLAITGGDLPSGNPEVLGAILGMSREVRAPLDPRSSVVDSPLPEGRGWPDDSRR